MKKPSWLHLSGYGHGTAYAYPLGHAAGTGFGGKLEEYGEYGEGFGCGIDQYGEDTGLGWGDGISRFYLDRVSGVELLLILVGNANT